MILDLDKLRNTEVKLAPYKYFIVENFIKTEFLKDAINSFPYIAKRGSFTLSSLKSDPFFIKLVDEFFSEELRNITAEKFLIDLNHSDKMITFRGHVGPLDGKIHIDSKGKIVTFLLYMNENWEEKSGGSLRILNGNTDINDFECDIEPKAGTLVVFECSPNAWHGHTQFVGPRKSMQFNYVKNGWYSKYEQVRHSFSALIKKLKFNI